MNALQALDNYLAKQDDISDEELDQAIISAINESKTVIKSRLHNDLHLFAKTLFPDHITSAIPTFHRTSYNIIQCLISRSTNPSKSVEGGYPPGSNKGTPSPSNFPKKIFQIDLHITLLVCRHLYQTSISLRRRTLEC